MTADQSHRFALTGEDPEGRNRTIILWREVDLVDGTVVQRVMVTLEHPDDRAGAIHSNRHETRHAQNAATPPGCSRPRYLTQGPSMVVHGVPDGLGDHHRQPAALP